MSGPVLFSDVDGLRGSGERGPRPGDVGGINWFVESVFVLDIMGRRAAKASPHSLGVRCMSWTVRRLSRQRAPPTGVGGVSRVVRLYEEVLPRKVGLPGVVAVYGRSCSRCFDVHHQGSSAGGRCGICAASARRCVVDALPVIGRGGQGTLGPRQVGRGCPDGAAPRVLGGVFPASARGGSGPGGFSHAPYEGAAEGT